MRRIITAREQVQMLKTADDLLASPPPSATLADPGVGSKAPATPNTPPPPTLTNIPRSEFDKILAPKGVTYDQHLDTLEGHFNAATEAQKKRGRVWYRAGGDILGDIGQKFKMSTNRAIAMAAALSGRTDWNNNLHFFAHMAGNYRPGENEDEWKRSNIHPSALARYMEDRHGIVPGEKAANDPTNPAHFSIKELKGLHKDGYMPRTKSDFKALANAHGGNHWQYNPNEIEPQTGKKGRWTNAPLRGFEELQTDEGRAAWLNNAQMSMRGNIKSSPNKWNPSPRRKKNDPEPKPELRKPWEDAIDAHLRQVRDSTSPYGFLPNSAYTGAGVPTLGGNIDKAKLLAQVSEHEFDKHLNGQKYKAFFSNLGNKLKFLKADRPEDQGYYDLGGKHWTELDPELLRSTIDTQHMRAASQPHGSSDPAPGYAESSVVTEKQYEVYQQGLIDLTHRINAKLPPHKQLLPHQVQAIIWGKFKDDMSDKKSSAGQTFFSPTMDGIIPFGDRYSRRRVGFHVHPHLLEPHLLDPYQTDSEEWFEAVMDSWEQNHQHELRGGPGVLARVADSLLDDVADVLYYSASVEKMSIPENPEGEWSSKLYDYIQNQPWPGHTTKDVPGDGPTRGYMVSIPEHAGTPYPYDRLSPDQLAEFARSRRDVVNADDDTYMGGWREIDDDGDNWYDDVSENDLDPWSAARKADERGEKAVYDLNEDHSVPTDEMMMQTHWGGDPNQPGWIFSRRRT